MYKKVGRVDFDHSQFCIHTLNIRTKKSNQEKMKVSATFIVFAVCLILSIVIEQSHSFPANENKEFDVFGPFDCPHNCWGNSSKFSFINKSILTLVGSKY